MRLFHRSTATLEDPEPEDEVPVELVAARLPADPVELGLLLRSEREQKGLTLEDLRRELQVPLVDLDALERGQLELLHTQQAAVVVLWRYADRLGLDPERLAGVLRTHWPHRGLAVNAIASRRGFTPIAELKAAAQLLAPISDPMVLNLSVGLSDTTKAVLESRSAKHLLALQLLAPANAIARMQLGGSSVRALPASGLADEDGDPLYTGGLYEDPSNQLGAPHFDDAAAIERFVSVTASLETVEPSGTLDPEEPDAPAPETDDLGVEDADGEEPQLMDDDVVADDLTPTASEVIDQETGDRETGAQYAVEDSTSEELRASDEVVDEPGLSDGPGAMAADATTPVPTVQPTSEAPATNEPPAITAPSSSMLPNLGILLGNAEVGGHKVRDIGRFIAKRFGLTPESEGDDEGAPKR